MKRRTFIRTGAGAAALGAAGCSMFRSAYDLPRQQVEYTADIFTQTRKAPAGTMPQRMLGDTGVRVSAFSFGSHINSALLGYEKERTRIIREAHDMGVNLFDVYERNYHQYEPMGRIIEPIKHDIMISVRCHEYDAVWEGNPRVLSIEEELEQSLRLLKRDYIDFSRNLSPTPDNRREAYWETLFKLKEQGKIRFVGTAIHRPHEIDHIIANYPIDYVVFPFNFYHNLNYTGEFVGDFNPMVKKLRDSGIGVVTMKPFASEWFIPHLVKASRKLDETGEIELGAAMLKWIYNADITPDTTLGGMYSINEVYENIGAYFNPSMTPEETAHLEKLREVCRIIAGDVLPDHYRFLDEWAPDSGMAHTA